MYEDKAIIERARFRKDGKLEVYQGKDLQGNVITLLTDYIVGYITDITEYKSVYNNIEQPYLRIHFVDENQVKSTLQVHELSYFTRSLFNKLLGADLNKMVKIGSWVKDEYINPVVYQDDVRVEWKYDPKTLPKAKEVKLESGDLAKDNGDVRKWIAETIVELKNMLGKRIQTTPLPSAEQIKKDHEELENAKKAFEVENDQEGFGEDLPF